jgi:phage N-6-adenine-methyltransferase
MSNDNWGTPQYIFDWLDDEFDFDLDAAANDNNHKCRWYFTLEANKKYFPNGSLDIPWRDAGVTFWMNPPYSDPYPWVKKAYEESQKGCTVVCLLPADTSTKWFHEWVIGKAEIRFIRGRIKFIDPETGKEAKNSPKFGCMVAIYGPGITSCVKSVDRPSKYGDISCGK